MGPSIWAKTDRQALAVCLNPQPTQFGSSRFLSAETSMVLLEQILVYGFLPALPLCYETSEICHFILLKSVTLLPLGPVLTVPRNCSKPFQDALDMYSTYRGLNGTIYLYNTLLIYRYKMYYELNRPICIQLIKYAPLSSQCVSKISFLR